MKRSVRANQRLINLMKLTNNNSKISTMYKTPIMNEYEFESSYLRLLEGY
jgi:hypothetical protein